VKLTSKTRLALRILLQLAVDSGEGRWVHGRALAERQSLNQGYLEQIMITLRRGRLVRTVRGRNGGYQIGRDPREISILHLVELFDGPINIGGQPHSSRDSEAVDEFGADLVWREIGDKLRTWLGETTLHYILERQRQGLNFTI